MEGIKVLSVEKKGKKYLVYVSTEEEPIKLTEDSIVNNRILKGSVIDAETWEKIKKGKDAAFIFDKVLNYIDFKPRTTKEIRTYLKQKEIDNETINNIIERLEEIHYLDDDKYTKMYIEEGIKNKKGPQLIIYSLSELGIDKGLINKYLSLYTKDLMQDNALDVGKKHQKLNLKYPAKKQRELVFQKLSRSGYYTETINYVLNNLDYPSDSMEQLKDEYQKLKKKTDDKNKIITTLITKGYRYEDIKKIIES
ncbi:MAG: RecX family transcriptional regulator [Bacilli bacterium]|nr:RecX family transcriptional regulator [Bacilli bacterium]